MTCCFLYVDRIIVTHSRKRTTSVLPEKIVQVRTGSMVAIDIGKLGGPINKSKWIISCIFGLITSRNPKTANLATTDKYGLGSGQWPRMTFERSRRNVRSQMWSSSNLSHASCPRSSQWQQVTCLKMRFRWKPVRVDPLKTSWYHALTSPVFFFTKVAQSMPHTLRKIWALSANGFSDHFGMTHVRGALSPPPPTCRRI